MSVFVVLLRAIGAGTHRKMSMADWRAAAEADGFVGPQTWLASGNMLVEAEDSAAGVARRMDRLVTGFGLNAQNAVVRTPGQLARLVRANPFPDAATEHPSQMGVFFFAAAQPDFGWIRDYDGPERLRVVGKHLVVDYTHPISSSPALPGLIERRSGTVTARNWNTLAGLAERAETRKAGTSR